MHEISVSLRVKDPGLPKPAQYQVVIKDSKTFRFVFVLEYIYFYNFNQ
jgi:ribosomal protein S16